MANETTTTTLTEIVGSEWIQPSFHDYAHDFVVATPYLKRQDLRGKGTSTWTTPSIQSDIGTPGDAGASVDTEFDGTEGTTLSNTQMDLAQVQISTSELGIMRTLTDNALEDVVMGFDLIAEIVGDAARVLTTAFEDDVCALFSSFTTVVGTSGSNLTIANMSDCPVTIRNAGIRAPGGLVYVLDFQQGADYEDAVIATSTSAASYAQLANDHLQASFDSNSGLDTGMIGMFKNYPVVTTGLTDTANTAADVVGACFVRGDAASNARMAALGMAVSREFRIETQRDASLRGTEIVATLRQGAGILLNAAGVGIVTDA